MKIRVFTLNANGKIELTKQELEELLNEAYQDGRINTVTITTPSWPYTWTSTDTSFTLSNVNGDAISATNAL